MATANGPLRLSTSLAYLKGAGPQAASALRQLGLETLQDLAFHLPIRYEDRRAPTPLSELRGGEDALVRGRVINAEVQFGGRRTLRVLVEDDRGALLLRFFHFNEVQRKQLVAGAWVQAYGTPRAVNGGFDMVHPEYRVAADPAGFDTEDSLTPIYGLTAGVTQPRMRKLVSQAVAIAARAPELLAPLPGLPEPSTAAALNLIHHPPNGTDAQQLMAQRHPAQARLIREELLAHQLCMRVLRQQVRQRPAPRIPDLSAAAAALQAVLPFSFTGAQQRVIVEVGQDIAGERPMLRLVQGDVGSGKTVVAAAAMLAAVRAGGQTALMAPTELLVEQHYRNLSQWFAPLGIEVVMLAGKQKKAQRAAALEAVASGATRVVVGTHAIFQDTVAFGRLTLVVVDEQHRFGVQQRLSLRDKGPQGTAPHQLIMSATPIPRTLAQTVYADLDVSVIDELPPGRTPVHTVVVNNQRRGEILQRIAEACRSGRQVYWVCTLIEESENLEAEAAQATAERLKAEMPQVAVGLVHGRMKPADKDAAMRAFKDAETQLLVATTVIEVGVDVPNASIMVIENAERLGLAQLHQLRGRVGRGSTASQCVLMYQAPLSDAGKARLETMRSTTDGFVIAQRDLELRGPGEILGRRQTGVIGLKLADPVRDQALIPPLQQLADRWIREQPAESRRLIQRWVGDPERYGQV